MINIANEMKVIIDFVDSYFLAQLNVLLTTINIFVSTFLRGNCCRNILLGRGCNFNPCVLTLVNFLLFFTACHIHVTASDLATGSKY